MATPADLRRHLLHPSRPTAGGSPPRSAPAGHFASAVAPTGTGGLPAGQVQGVRSHPARPALSAPKGPRSSAPVSAPGDTCTGAARREARKRRCTPPCTQVHRPAGGRCMAAPRSFGVAAGLVHRAMIVYLGRSHTCPGGCAAGQEPGCRRSWSGWRLAHPSSLANRDDCRARAASTLARIVPNVGRLRLAPALVVDAIDESFWNGTRGTSTWRETTRYGMSVRSSSGPERRPVQRGRG